MHLHYTHKAIVIDGIDVLLLRNHVAEASAGRVLERDTRRFGSKDPVDVVPVVKLIVEAFRNIDLLIWVSILDYDEMIRLEERPPHFEKVQISYRRYDYVQLVDQRRRDWHRRLRHWQAEQSERRNRDVRGR